jgi:phenylacetate-CoA ligase
MDIRVLLKTLRAIRQLRQHETWTRPQLEVYQSQALRRLRDYAYARSPFYQRFHHGLFDRPLRELPVLTKATLMAHFDDLVTDRSVHLESRPGPCRRAPGGPPLPRPLLGGGHLRQQRPAGPLSL